MSRCFTCASKFGIFKREHSCKSCGKSVCSSCLTYKLFIEKYGDKEQSVCRSCFDSSNRNLPEAPPPYSEAPPPYPGNLKGNELNNVSATTTPTTRSATDPDAVIRERLSKLKEHDKGASDGGKKATDEEIADRLANLTGDSGKKATDQEIADRLANLSGRIPPSIAKGNILTPQPKLSEQEEINKLLQQVTAEVGLDDTEDDNAEQTNSSIKELEARLLKVKGIDPASSSRPPEDFDSSDDEFEATAKVIKKVLEEDRLDENIKQSGYGHLIDGAGTKKTDIWNKELPSVPGTSVSKPWMPSKSDDEDDELPWCCICNDDAMVRCHGCDDDLYCKRCFREGHSSEDLRYHHTSPYRKKKKGS